MVCEEGRNIGIGLTLITQRSARLNKNVAELADLLVSFRVVGPNSIDAITDWMGDHIAKDKHKSVVEELRRLPVGNALVISPGWLQHEGVVPIRMRETFDWGLIRCIFGFSVGAITWHVHRAGWLRSGSVLELTSVVLIVAFVCHAGNSSLSLAAPAVFALAVLVFAAEAGAVSRLLRAPAWLWLGERSYSIYMVHFLVVWLLADGVKLLRLAQIELIAGSENASRLWQNDVLFLIYSVLVLGVAAGTYRVIEVPARSGFRRLAAPRARQDARIAMQTAPQHAVID